MVWCATLRVWLPAAVSLLACVNTLPLPPSEGISLRTGEQPEGAQGLTESVLAPATHISPLSSLEGLSQDIVPTNQVERPAGNGSTVQPRASVAGLQDSGWRVKSTTIGPVEVHGGVDATLPSVRARRGYGGEGPLSQTEGEDSGDVLVLKKPEDTQGPGLGNTQNRRKERDSEEGPNLGPAGYRAPGGVGSNYTSQNPNSPPEAERAGPAGVVAADPSLIPETLFEAEVRKTVGASKQGVSDPAPDSLSPSRAPVLQELSGQGGAQAGPQVTGAAQIKDSDVSGAQSEAGLPELGALLFAREEPGAGGNERGADTAKKPPENRTGVPGGDVQTATAAGGEAAAGTSGPSPSSAPSSEQTRPRQTTAIYGVPQSAASVSKVRESEAASSPSTPGPHPDPINNASVGESRAGADAARPDRADPRRSEPPRGGDPAGTELGVAATPWAGGVLQQDAVKRGTPGSTGPVDGVTPNVLLTARAETRTREENPALQALSFGHDDVETPTPDDIPLIFDPLDDTPSEVAVTAAPSGTQQALQYSGITADASDILIGPELITTVVVDGGSYPSGAAPPALPSGPLLPSQTSGTRILEAPSPSTSLFTAPPPEPPHDYGILHPDELGISDTPAGTTDGSPSSFRTQEYKNTDLSQPTIVAMTSTMSQPRQKSAVDELESEEEQGEEKMEESKEAGSEEDVTEVTTAAHARPAHTHVPYHFHPGSIWVQRNQGLVHSWVEKIRDKAGYVSGMLAPVGIGIAGALFILGALYSLKVVHRRRRKGCKRQTRKHRESGSRQDRVMLLADSSEDEF